MDRLDILYEATERDISCLKRNKENVPAQELAGRYKKSFDALQERITRQLGEIIVFMCFDRLPRQEDGDEKDRKLYEDCRRKAFFTFSSAGAQEAWKKSKRQALDEYDLIGAIDSAVAVMAGPAEEQYLYYWDRHCKKEGGEVRNDLIGGTWDRQENAWVLKNGAITFMFPYSETDGKKKCVSDLEGQMSIYEMAVEL